MTKRPPKWELSDEWNAEEDLNDLEEIGEDWGELKKIDKGESRSFLDFVDNQIDNASKV